MSRLLITALSAAALCVGGCSGDEVASGVDGVTVTKAATPKVTVAKGLSTDKTEVKVIEDGGGEKVAVGDTVKINYLIVNGRTGDQFDSSFAAGRPSTLVVSKNNLLPGFIKAIDGQTVGSRVLAAVAPADGFGAARSDLDVRKDDTIVYLIDIVAKLPSEATGKTKKAPATLPQLVLDASGRPEKFESDAQVPPEVTRESAHVLIQGTGDTIEEGQQVSAQYVGQVYPAGEVFDSSWSRETPGSFVMTPGQNIDCLADLLVGQKVGSRVVLVCPADSAFGDEGRAPDVKPGDTLIFAVDVLDAA